MSPQTAQLMQGAQEGKLPYKGELEEAKKAPRVEKAKFLKAFARINALQGEFEQSMRKYAQPKSQEEEKQFLAHVYIEKAKLEDVIFVEEGVATEDVELSMMYYMEQKDPEALKAIAQIQFQMMMQAQQAEQARQGVMDR